MRKLGLFLGALVACGGSDATVGDGGNSDGSSPNDSGSSTDSGAHMDSGANMDSGTGMDSGSGMDSGGMDSGGQMDAGSDGGGMLTGRLFVSMEAQAPAVWNNADTLNMDTSPSFTLSDSSVTSGTRGLALANKRLFVGTSQSSGILLLFTGATSITSMSKAKALFTHQFQQVPGFAYDNVGDHAILGQISGAGVLEWNSASSASGTPAFSFTLDKMAADWSLAIEKDRLYGIGHYGNPEVIAVWKGISGTTMATAPSFTMGTMSGIAAQDFSPFVGVQNDVLIACIQSGKVLLSDQSVVFGGRTNADTNDHDRQSPESEQGVHRSGDRTPLRAR